MYDLISVDPGVNNCGIATFNKGVLNFAILKPTAKLLLNLKMAPAAYLNIPCVIEVPQIYRASRSKGDPNDLLNLAIVVGRIYERCEGATLIKPRTWKGTVKKEVMLKRILSKLSQEELDKLPKLCKSQLHNVIDAVGIGLHALGRL